MLEKIPSGKSNVTKNTLFFSFRAPTYHSFTFNSQFLYELKHMFHLFKTSGVTESKKEQRVGTKKRHYEFTQVLAITKPFISSRCFKKIIL